MNTQHRISISRSLALAALVIGAQPALATTYGDDPISVVEDVLAEPWRKHPATFHRSTHRRRLSGTLTPGNQFDLDPNQDLKQRCDEIVGQTL